MRSEVTRGVPAEPNGGRKAPMPRPAPRRPAILAHSARRPVNTAVQAHGKGDYPAGVPEVVYYTRSYDPVTQ